MTEHVKQRHMFMQNRVKPAWSISFREAPECPDGVREDLARNMIAEIAIGDASVRNDFDGISIFQRPIFNASWNETGKCWENFVKQGEEGFTFTPTEKNREVVYRCRPFWYYIEYDANDRGPVFVSVAAQPLEGYRLAPMFRNGTDYEYRPCFELGLGEDGLPHSRAGLLPLEETPTALMTHAQQYSAYAHTETMADWFSDYLLLLVEFGTRNLQGIMHGFSAGEISTYPVYTYEYNEETEEEKFVEKGFWVEDISHIAIGDRFYLLYDDMDLSKTIERTVTVFDIKENDEGDGYLLDFRLEDFEEIANMYMSHTLYQAPPMTGAALPLVTNASSGIPYTRSDGCVPCVWRGKENPWGSTGSLICDMLYTTTDFYAQGHRLSDPTKFDGTRNEHYVLCDAKTVRFTHIGTRYGIKGFTMLGDTHCIIPASFTLYPETYFATCFKVDGTGRNAVLYLRVGGAFKETRGNNHATFELFGSTRTEALFGARLVLKNGG